MYCIFAQTTPIPDSNFEQELIDQGIDSNGLNGNILNVDAQAITALTLGRTDIADITGINAFVNITTLDLGTNPVVNVSPTNLIQLVSFRSDDNSGLLNLDFSQNSLLETVFIHGPFPGTPPPITTIDLSQNLNLVSFTGDFLDNVNTIIFPVTSTLTNIDVRYLSDPTFDLSLLSGLEDLRIGGWRGNVNITLPNVYTSLRRLRISSIDIPTIDISNYINLENIYFWGTYVENLLLPTSTTLTDIFIILHDIQNPLDFSVLPNLEDLSITSNRTTPLVVDVTQNSVLRDIDLSRNNMNALDVTQNSILRELRVDNNNLTVLDVTQNPLLYRLDASYNQLPSIDLTQNPVLEYLNLSNNVIPTLDVTQNVALRSINISFNLFTGSGLDLTQNLDLSSLDISHNQIASLNITQNADLTSFNLSFNIFPGNNILNQFATLTANRGRLLGRLIANNNLLSGPIPDFYGLYDPTIQTRRFELFINENRFHFGDFESQHLGLVNLTTTMSIGPSPDVVIRNYWYAPQDKVNNIENFNRNAGDNITLTTTVRGAQNHYVWFKDGIAIPGAPDSPNLILTDISSCDAGVYHCEIRSDLVPFENGNPPGTDGKNLLLLRNDITLNVNSPAESCVSLTSPTNGSTAVALNEVLTWTENFGACGYYLNVGTTPGGTDILNNVQVENTNSYTFGSNLPPNQQVYVTITPYFASGNVLNCTEEVFTTGTNINPLTCTTLNTPIDGASNVAVDTNISWNAISGATGYNLTLATTSGGIDILDNVDVGNITTYNPPLNFPQGTTIYVTVTPYDGSGNATGCTEERFTVESLLPNCTTLSLPVNGASGISISSDVSWNAVTNATGYFISIGTTSGGTDIVNNQDVGNATTYNPVSDFPDDTDIFVTITPYNRAGSALGCSEESFRTETVIPNCTTLSLPVNGATWISISSDVSWNAVTSATGYFISIGTTSGGTDIVNNQDMGNATTYNPASDFPDDTDIFVTITPYNTAGSALGCSEESFRTETVTPNCTTLSLPVNGATGISISSDVSWNAVTNATGYFISIGTTSGGTDIVNNQDVGNATTYNPASDFPDDTEIFVTITPYNTAGSALGCSEESFRTEVLIPICTRLTNPINGATNIALDAGISWNTIANATGYYVSTGTFSGGTDIANMLDVGNVTSFNPTLNFPDESDIFVTVIPYNSAGNATSCQEERFTTQAIIPVCTVITLPLTGAQDVPVDTNITWGFINNADGYRITIGTSSGSFDIENNLDVGRLNSYTPTNNFPDNATIYIKIIPYNSAGEALNCDEFSFTTENRVVVIPRFFTPNNDGFNDIWRVSDPRKEIKRIFIYDRYGKLLKTLADASVGWDGYISGKLLPTSDYWCVIEFYDKAPIRKHFTLKR
jgi:gliding motility-associated-like protein